MGVHVEQNPVAAHSRQLVVPVLEERMPRIESLVCSVLVGACSLIAGYLLVFRFQNIDSDALSRVISGFYTVWQGNFHLAALGFIWQPLIGIIAIPFSLIRDVWPPLITNGFVANITSAGFAAIGVYFMNQIFHQLGLPRTPRIVFTVLYALNPLVFLYGANGMTDGILAACIVASLNALLRYSRTDRLSSLLNAGVWLALGFMVRYEAVPVGGFMGIGLYVAVLRSKRTPGEAEGSALILWFPLVSACLSWVLLNWMIMKDPIYFINSPYGNADQLSTGIYNDPWVAAMAHQMVGTVLHVLKWTVNFAAFLPAFLVVLWRQLRGSRDRFGLPLLAGSLGVPVLQCFLLYENKSADWQRFFIYYVPFGVVMIAYLLSQLPDRRRILVAWLVVPVLLCCNVITFDAMKTPQWGHGNNIIVNQVLQGKTNSINTKLLANEQVGEWVNQHPHMRILISTWSSNMTIPYITVNTRRITTDADADYQSVLLNPRGRIDAILVAPPSPLIKLGSMYHAYPGLYEGKEPWAKLIHTFPSGAKLYKLLPNAP